MESIQTPLECIKDGHMKQSKITNGIAETIIRLNTGQGYFYAIRNAFLISASLKVLFDLNVFLAGGLSIVILSCFWLVGALDLKHWKVMQRIQELMTSKYNPHLNKIK